MSFGMVYLCHLCLFRKRFVGETTPSDEELHRGIVYLSAWTSVAVYYLWQAKALKRKQWRSLRFFCVHWIETENNYTLLFINKKTN